MSVNIHLRGVDERTLHAIKTEATHQEMSINSFILSLIKKGLGLTQERDTTTFHDIDKLAGTWNKNQAKSFMSKIADFEQIDKELWK